MAKLQTRAKARDYILVLNSDLSQHSETAYILTSDYEELTSPHNSSDIPAGAKIRSQNA